MINIPYMLLLSQFGSPNKQVIINASEIRYAARAQTTVSGKPEVLCYTRVAFKDGSSVTVEETPEHIQGLIESMFHSLTRSVSYDAKGQVD